MSDNVPRSKLVWVDPITADEFQSHLDRYGIEKPCPDCGATNWDILIDQDESVMLVTMPDTRLEHYLGYYVLECHECGHAKHYASRIVNPKLGKRHG